MTTSGQRRLGALVLSAAAAAAALADSTPPAAAQMVCGDRDKMIGSLDREYQETQAGLGIASNGALVELYVAKSGSWTMLVSPPGGATCVVGTGRGWKSSSAPAEPGEPL